MSDPTPEPGTTAAAEARAEALPFVLGIVGGSGSGKSTLSDGVRTLIGPGRVTDLKLDDYHRFTREERAEKGVTALNPTVHNFSLMQEHLLLLRRGRPIHNRSYEHADGTFGPIRTVEPNDVVLVRGLLGFPTEELRSAYDLTVFLHPDPELLIRWKLRRDVNSRGYTPGGVLMHITQHLLDGKQHVLPQADRADVVVRYRLPEEDAPDEAVDTSLLLRRAAADVVAGLGLEARFGGAVRIGEEGGGEVRVDLSTALSDEAVEAWGREHFPETYDPERVGCYQDESDGRGRRPHLAFTEVLISLLAERLRQTS